MNRADQGNPTQDLDKGRGWLGRAAGALSAGQDSPRSAVEFARAAAAIGRGFVALAQVEATRLVRSTEALPPMLRAAVVRAGQAAEEARPHDGEPRGEAAHWLEGDDEVFTAAEPMPPCGRSDDACGLRGGSAHCGGCND